MAILIRDVQAPSMFDLLEDMTDYLIAELCISPSTKNRHVIVNTHKKKYFKNRVLQQSIQFVWTSV